MTQPRHREPVVGPGRGLGRCGAGTMSGIGLRLRSSKSFGHTIGRIAGGSRMESVPLTCVSLYGAVRSLH